MIEGVARSSIWVAWPTFSVEKAQRFLNIYESAFQKGTMRTKAQAQALKYMNRDLFCFLSKFKLDEILLQILRKETKNRENQTRIKTSADDFAEQIDCEFEYIWVRCGFWNYQASDLVFVSQIVNRRMSFIMFEKKNLMLMTRSNDSALVTYRLDVFYLSVQFITIESFQDSSLIITLSEASRIYQQSINDSNFIQS